MSRVITFSRVFPAYHPKKGQPTYFVEKVLQSLKVQAYALPTNVVPIISHEILLHNYSPKHHTIRSGNRWKVGNKFSPRVWSGKPYNSKQIIIAPDIEIKKIWDVKVEKEHFNLLSPPTQTP